MKFRPVCIEDKSIIESFTYAAAIDNCDLAFANMFCWAGSYRSAWCVEDGFLMIRFYIDGGTQIGYMLPLGGDDFMRMIPALEADARAVGQPLRLTGLAWEHVATLRQAMPEFAIRHNRDFDDYLYRADDLRHLPGRHYQPKRNHINRFVTTYPYRYVELTPELFADCMSLERQWRQVHTAENPVELTAEQHAMRRAFDHFSELQMRGGALFVEQQLVAFTYGSAIDATTFCIHVEKADTRYEGAYTLINKLFAEQLPAQYTLINREEDLGLAGLRKSKLSYHPVSLHPKCTAMRLTAEQQQVRALWLDSFDDTIDNVEQFLLTHYDTTRMHAVWREGRLLAMLHVVPFGEVAYIYAVATAKEWRNRGYATHLLHEAMDACRVAGFSAMTLIPDDDALRRWYARIGFVGAIPVTFSSHDGYDFGTGDSTRDCAMMLPLVPTYRIPEVLTLQQHEDRLIP